MLVMTIFSYSFGTVNLNCLPSLAAQIVNIYVYSGNADFFVPNGVSVPFSYHFRIASFYAVSNAV